MPFADHARALSRRIRRWRRGVRHQITWSGVAFSALIIMVGLGAFASGNNLLFLLLAALISTMLVSGFVSRLGLSGLEVRLILPDHVFAKRKLPARIELHNTKPWMPSFSIHLASSDEEETPGIFFPIIPGGGTQGTLTTVFFRRRGLHGESDYYFTTRFPFGFTERRLQVSLPREVLVYPSIDPQPEFEDLAHSLGGEIESHLRGRGHDFHRIRPYQQTESARHVDWKATAHTGEVQVREFARDEDNLVEIFLDLNVPFESLSWFEQAVDCVAFLVWTLSLRNARLRFASQTADIRLPENGDVYTILRFLALVEPNRSRARVYAHEESSFKVVFSATPAGLDHAGWHRARLFGPDSFRGAPQPRTGEKLRNRRRSH